MSKAVSALNGASYDGFVRVSETGLRGMITLRGDLGSKKLAAAVKAATGAAMPKQRKITKGAKGLVAWMSPDELLLVVAYADAGEVVAALDAALSGEHALAVNVSDARAVFRLEGAGVRDVLAKTCPVDLAKDAFGAGDLRRTRLAQVPAAFWANEDDSFELVCFRSVAQYAFDVLKVSAQPSGEVNFL